MNCEAWSVLRIPFILRHTESEGRDPLLGDHMSWHMLPGVLLSALASFGASVAHATFVVAHDEEALLGEVVHLDFRHAAELVLELWRPLVVIYGTEGFLAQKVRCQRPGAYLPQLLAAVTSKSYSGLTGGMIAAYSVALSDMVFVVDRDRG